MPRVATTSEGVIRLPTCVEEQDEAVPEVSVGQSMLSVAMGDKDEVILVLPPGYKGSIVESGKIHVSRSEQGDSLYPQQTTRCDRRVPRASELAVVH